jgi:hypothetical protein
LHSIEVDGIVVFDCQWQLLVHGGCLFMGAAGSWQLLVHGGCLFMVATGQWRLLVYGSRSFMAAAHSWRLLVRGGRLFMAAAVCQYYWPIYCRGASFLGNNLFPVKIKICGNFCTYQHCS